jgi:hypothetical protein
MHLFFFERGKARFARPRQVDLAAQGQHAFDVLRGDQAAEADLLGTHFLAAGEQGRGRGVDGALPWRNAVAPQPRERGARCHQHAAPVRACGGFMVCA